MALHRHDRELKIKSIDFIPCSARTICSFCQTIIFFGAISKHCEGRRPVYVMVNTLFLECTSCCCSTPSLINMPPATTYLKIFRPGQPYRLSACILSMQHNHGLTRTVLCLLKNIGVQNRLTSFMFIKPTKIHLKGVWNSSHSKFCRITSCYLVKHNIMMAPKASLTYMPTTEAWRPLALVWAKISSCEKSSHRNNFLWYKFW